MFQHGVDISNISDAHKNASGGSGLDQSLFAEDVPPDSHAYNASGQLFT